MKKRIEFKQGYIGSGLVDKVIITEDLAKTITGCFERLRADEKNRPMLEPVMSAAVFPTFVVANGDPFNVTITVTRDIYRLKDSKWGWEFGSFRFGGIRPENALFTSRLWLVKRMIQKGWL